MNGLSTSTDLTEELPGVSAKQLRNRKASRRWRSRNAGTLGFRLTERLRHAQRRARKTGRPCTITLADLENLWAQQGGRCALTGVPLTVTSTGDGDHFSVDRIDNASGYTPNNVQLVTNWANMAKGTLGLDEFALRCARVASYLGGWVV